MDGFHRDYAKALAEALLEAEATPPDSSQVVQETYRQLCHDYPIGLDSQALLTIARRLRQDDLDASTSNIVLTDRFVNGLLQALDRVTTQPSSAHAEQASEDENDASVYEPLVAAAHHDQHTESALAALAWTVFGQIPFQVLTSYKLEQAAKLLGQFHGSPVVLDEADLNEAEPSIEEPLSQDAAIINGNSHAAFSVNNELDEVWADESDGSDFEFESDRFHAVASHDENEFDEPMVATADSWLQIAQAISNLLSQLTMTKLSSLSMSQWKKLGLSNHLLQLSLMLLLPQSDSPLLQVYPPHHWQTLALNPIHYFRDATLQNVNDLLEDYLQFLTALLQAQSAESNAQHLLPCTILAVSLLSSLSSALMNEPKPTIRHLKLVRQSIFESSDELVVILEVAMNDTNDSSNTAPAVPWTFLALWHVIVAACGTASLENAQAQMLLNSGLFRQWLQFWERTEDAEACRVLEESIFDLCVVSPKLMGKYAWRYSGFAGRVCRLPAGKEDGAELESAPSLLDTVQWNLLAAELAEQAAMPAVVWKKKPVNGSVPEVLPPPSLASCQAAAWDAFLLSSELVVESISDWKRRRQENLPASLKLEKQREAVTCFAQLLDRLCSRPQLLSSDFMDRLLERDGQASSSAARTRAVSLEPIQKVLVEWPLAPTLSMDQPLPKVKGRETEDTLTEVDDKKESIHDEEDEPLADPSIRKARLEDQTVEEAIRQLRKSLKSFQSLLDSAALSRNAGDGAVVVSVSSKAD